MRFKSPCVLCVLLFATFIIFFKMPVQIAKADTSTPVCLADGGDISDRSVWHPTIAESSKIASGYQLPSVVGLWQNIKANELSVADPETKRSLAKLQKTNSDSFALIANEANLMGGDILTIMFNHHSDDLYWVWMYHTSPDAWVVRALEKEKCSPERLKWLRNRYQVILPPQTFSANQPRD